MASYYDNRLGATRVEALDRVPLTAAQKARLLFDCILHPYGVLGAGLCLLPGDSAATYGHSVACFFAPCGLRHSSGRSQGCSALRDLFAGEALVQTDLLQRLRRLDKRGS